MLECRAGHARWTSLDLKHSLVLSENAMSRVHRNITPQRPCARRPIDDIERVPRLSCLFLDFYLTLVGIPGILDDCCNSHLYPTPYSSPATRFSHSRFSKESRIRLCLPLHTVFLHSSTGTPCHVFTETEQPTSWQRKWVAFKVHPVRNRSVFLPR